MAGQAWGDSLVADVFRQHYEVLVSAIQDPESLADGLFSRKVIGMGLLQEVQLESLTKAKKSRKLLFAVQNQLVVNPCKFTEVVEVLQGFDILESVVEKLQSDYLVATQKLNLEDLEVELRHVHGWVHLGLCLDLPKHSLDEIHASHGSGFDALGKCKIKMLAMWLERCKNPTWSTFIAALLDARLWSTASKIAAKYGIELPSEVLPKGKAPPQIEDVVPDAEQVKSIIAMREKVELKHMELHEINEGIEQNEKEIQMLKNKLRSIKSRQQSKERYIGLLMSDLQVQQLESACREDEKQQLELQMRRLELRESPVPEEVRKQFNQAQESITSCQCKSSQLESQIKSLQQASSELALQLEKMSSNFDDIANELEGLQTQKKELLQDVHMREQELDSCLLGKSTTTPLLPANAETAYYNIIMCAGRVEVKLRLSEIDEYERKLMEKEVEVGNLRKNLKQQQKLLQELKDKPYSSESDYDYDYAYMHMESKNEMKVYEMEQRISKLETNNLQYKMQLALVGSQKYALETEMQALIQEVATAKTAQAILEQKIKKSEPPVSSKPETPPPTPLPITKPPPTPTPRKWSFPSETQDPGTSGSPIRDSAAGSEQPEDTYPLSTHSSDPAYTYIPTGSEPTATTGFHPTLESSEMQHEDSTTLSYRTQDPGTFGSAGIYVPTEEQRIAAGNHYESGPAKAKSKSKKASNPGGFFRSRGRFFPQLLNKLRGRPAGLEKPQNQNGIKNPNYESNSSDPAYTYIPTESEPTATTWFYPTHKSSENQYEDPTLEFSEIQYEGPTLEFSEIPYEEPTLSYPTQDPDTFGSVGIYVPTEEQRNAAGNHYEMLESNEYNTLEFFVEDQTYWTPASTTSDLYAQLAAKKYREIPRRQIVLGEKLGSGQFGEVCKSQWKFSGTSLEAAAKTLKIHAPEEEKVRFLREAAIMGQFCHPNVVRLYGVVTMREPSMIILELMPNGDLRSYLKELEWEDESKVQHLFLWFAREIAAGMVYLSKKSFVHRDLAARNILLDQNVKCKIGDFGMSRDLLDDTYYTSKGGGLVPVKWTAPEALVYRKYSVSSDVWSYAMVLFEIWSVGRKPFQDIMNTEVIPLVSTGHCQPPAPGCPKEIYRLMVDCWNPAHHERPTFVGVSDYLNQPDSLLLSWKEEDDASSTKKARELGAEISESRHLYLDLQHKYMYK